MTDRYEMPHPRADECRHAGVGKACRPCRDRFVVPEAAVEALDALVEVAKVGVVGSVRQMVDDFAKDVRAGLLTAAPSATREDVARAIFDAGAARAEAERRWPSAIPSDEYVYSSGSAREYMREAFETGAAWQREQVASEA